MVTAIGLSMMWISMLRARSLLYPSHTLVTVVPMTPFPDKRQALQYSHTFKSSRNRTKFVRQGGVAVVQATVEFNYNAQHDDASNVTKTELAPSLTYNVTNISDPKQITLNWGNDITIQQDLSIPELSEIINPYL